MPGGRSARAPTAVRSSARRRRLLARERVVPLGQIAARPVGGSLTAAAAGALNAAFGLRAGTVPAGLELGDATVSYKLLRW